MILFGPLFYFWCTYAAVSYCGGDKLAKIGRGLAIKSGQNHNDHFLQQPDLTGQCIISTARGSYSHTVPLQEWLQITAAQSMFKPSTPREHSLHLRSIASSAGCHFFVLCGIRVWCRVLRWTSHLSSLTISSAHRGDTMIQGGGEY